LEDNAEISLISMQKKNYISLLTVGLIATSLLIGGSVFAQNGQDNRIGQGKVGRPVGQMMGFGVFGTVASINGTTITVTSVPRLNMRKTATTTPTPSPITYTVDAKNAKVTKNNADSAVSAIAVGDTVMVQGTVTGTNIVAKTIRDEVGQPKQPAIQGNGQPIVAGSVTIISGNTITITNKSNITYTVDASNSKFVVRGITSPTISNIIVGDNLTVQGVVNGNSVVASSIIDQKVKADNNSGDNNEQPKRGFMGGMMNGIGNFFKHMFGF